MIVRLRGKILEVNEESLVLDVGGVGYEVSVPRTELENAPAPGEEIELFTHTHFNRDSGQRIFGFMTDAGLRVFRTLIGASGIGPKAGLSLLAGLSPQELVTAIVRGDTERLSAAPGVSRKGAERLCLELRDKFKEEPGAVSSVRRGGYEDALAALVALGYPTAQARHALAGLGDKQQGKAEELVKQALRKLSK